MSPELYNPLITVAGTAVVAIISFIMKRIIVRIDGLDGQLNAVDAMTSARIHNLDQATQARISSVEQVADAKIRDHQLAHSSREDSIVHMVIEHTNESDRKYATVRELLNVQERLLAIDNNVRAVLTAIDRLAHGGG